MRISVRKEGISAYLFQNLRLSYTAREWERDRYRDQMENTVPCGNVHTGLRQGQGPGPIFPYCASPIHVSVQCDWTIRPNFLHGSTTKRSSLRTEH